VSQTATAVNEIPTAEAAVERGDDSREKILRAAEKIFAEKGLAGASVRAITRAAGVNHALIGYYFGSKVALYQEVLERASKLLSAPRMQALAALRKKYGEKPIPLPELVDAYVRSFFDGYGETESLAATWLRFYGRCFTETEDEVRETTNNSGSPIRAEFLKEFQRTLPDHTLRELVYRLGATIGMITFWRAETGILDDHLADEPDDFVLDDLVEEVIAMSCAAFAVPPRSRRSAEVRTPAVAGLPKTARSITAVEQLGEKESSGRSRRHRKGAGSPD
jgi:AcrR family transcriptional regulator